MRKKSKVLITIAGVGLLGLLTGCGSEEPKIIPITPIEYVAPESTATSESSTSSADSVTSGDSQADSSQDATDSSQPIDTPLNPSNEEDSGVELIAAVDTEEQAREIADLYGIKLKSFSFGVAVYSTTKDPNEVIQTGIDKGYPLLSLNHEQKLFTN